MLMADAVAYAMRVRHQGGIAWHTKLLPQEAARSIHREVHAEPDVRWQGSKVIGVVLSER